MGFRKDLTGNKFGKLTVIEFDYDKNMWKCQCDCGGIKFASTRALSRKEVKSCGCLHREKVSKDITGNRYGKLVAVCLDHRDKDGRAYWKCRCDCGNEVVVAIKVLTVNGKTTCGNCLEKEFVGKKFGKLLVIEKAYIKDRKQYWKCQCDCGNITYVSTNSLRTQNTKSCGCSKYDYEDLSDSKFGMLMPIEYIGKNKWKCKCDCGNETVVLGNDLKTHSIVSCGCNNISKSGSADENEIRDFIKNYVDNIELHNKDILNGKEVDIYLPDYRLGIEFNGSIYHATKNGLYRNVDVKYHQQKFLLAKEKGVHLINIFDVDWHKNKDKIKMYLRFLLAQKEKIVARKCEIKKIDNILACDFVDKYHIQGSNKSLMKINYGLFYNNELMSVMSFGKLRLKKTEAGHYELHRYCVKDEYMIIGGANKLLNKFELDYSPNMIVSYSDNDYFLGGIYERLGFKDKGQCTPRYYWYLGHNELKREQCMIKQLRVDYPELLQEAYDVGASNKEDYVMVKLGARKVYRSGNTKWEKVK